MKKQFLTKFALATLAITMCGFNANAQLGNLKNKVKNAANNSGGKDNSSNTSANTTTSTNSVPSSTTSTNANKTGNPDWVNVSEPTFFSSTDYNFANGTQSSFGPGENFFLRFAFPKNVPETFTSLVNPDYQKSTGYLVLAIAKDENDENPIIMEKRQFSLNNYSKVNMVDFTLQADEATITKISNEPREKVCFTSSSSMAVTSLSEEWKRQSALFKDGKHEWMAILVFYLPEIEGGKTVEVGKGKFTYNISAENRGKLADGMNFYDKQRFEKTADDGMTTDLHKNNVGKLVFAKNKITKDFNDASALKNSFDNLSGGIYARLYLKESLRNVLANTGNGKDVGGAYYQLNFYVDGNKEPSCYEESELSKDEALMMTNWSIPLAPLNQADFDYDKNCVNRFAYVISELTPGKHKITIKAMFQTSADQESTISIGEGEFDINITAADRDAFVKKYGLQMPEKGLLAADAALAKDAKIVAGPTAIDVRCPNAWEYHKDAFGQIVDRSTIVAYSYKDKNGRCKQDTFMIKQMKKGSAYGPTQGSAEKVWFGLDPYLPLQNSK